MFRSCIFRARLGFDAMRVGIVDTEDQFAPTFVAKRHHIAQNAFAAVGGFAFPRTVVGEKSLIGFLEFDAIFRFLKMANFKKGVFLEHVRLGERGQGRWNGGEGRSHVPVLAFSGT